MLAEFREFVNRGNFVDLAVGFVMGVAVTGVVTSIVERLVMPLIAVLVEQPNFDAIGTFGEDGSVGAVVTALVNFLLIAFVLFLIVKAYNRMQRSVPDEAEPEADPEEVVLLREIRDALTAPRPEAPTTGEP